MGFDKQVLDQLGLYLTAHNWQKWKSTFPTCHCHEIYREEAVGLKNSNYIYKKKKKKKKNLRFLWTCEIWGISLTDIL